MNLLQLQEIVKNGESVSVEFKTCKDKLNKDAFDSICAFLNRSGGHLLLGVNDKKEVIENTFFKFNSSFSINVFKLRCQNMNFSYCFLLF